MFHPSFVTIIWCLVVVSFAGTVSSAVQDAGTISSDSTLQKNLPEQVDRATNVDYETNPKDTNVQTSPVVVDVAIVCSQQFAENFESNREKILDFFSAYFWDIKMQFQQLPSSRISFSVTSLTLIPSKEEQPFIEKLRDPEFGNASLARILSHFAHWISNKTDQLPGYDMAILVTEPGLDKTATGAAPLGGMCRTSIENSGLRITDAVTVLDGTLTTGAHQIARLLGVLHDDEMEMCKNCNLEKWRISQFLPFFADEYISKFMASDRSKCLKTKSSRVPLIDSDFDSVPPPSIEEQCRLLSGDRNASAIPKNEKNKCGLTKCMGHHSNLSIFISPLSNSECGNGRMCFHGRCIPPGLLLSNVGNGKCLVPKEASINGVREIAMSNCTKSSSPFERFHIESLSGTINKMLVVPCKLLSSSNLDGNGTEYQCMDQCLSATRPFEGLAKLEKCNGTNDLQKWILVDERREENNFLLFNVGSKSCLKAGIYKDPLLEPSETIFQGLTETVSLDIECNTTDLNFRWKSSPVLPLPGMCPNNDDCKASIKPLFNINVSCSSNLTTVIVNWEGVSIAPAAMSSWKSNITVILESCRNTKLEYCLRIQSALKKDAEILLNEFEMFLAKIDAPNTTFTSNDTKRVDKFLIALTIARIWETLGCLEDKYKKLSDSVEYLKTIPWEWVLLTFLSVNFGNFLYDFLSDQWAYMRRI